MKRPGMLTVTQEPGTVYPGPANDFSPSERYPEYEHDHLSTEPNSVYRQVRETLRLAQLDGENFGTAAWNPLGEYIKPRQTVFLLCNFVYHRRPQESEEDFFAKCTHASVVRAMCDYALKANRGLAPVYFGNSPLQSCNWAKVLHDTGADRLEEFYRLRGKQVQARDLRKYVAERTAVGTYANEEQRDASDIVGVDLGTNSLLDELVGDTASPFRITDYPTDRIGTCHGQGKHVYLINKAVIDSDVIVSIPKLKTHEKVGITCHLKGFVGTIGLKDCLAHHRFGDPARGGDEYPSRWKLQVRTSRFHDFVNDSTSRPYGPLLRALDVLIRRAYRVAGVTQAGAWEGNDTAWRMSLDIVRAVLHARRDGTLAEAPQRKLVGLIDGVVAGEGQGPLAPSPVRAGVLVWSDDLVSGDLAAIRLMGFAEQKIKLVTESFGLRTLRVSGLTKQESRAQSVNYRGSLVPLEQLRMAMERSFATPQNWTM